MAITRNEVIGILGLLGITGTAQEGATEGGFILPDFITQLAQTVPLPVLVVVGAIAYYIWKKEGGDREIICSSCDCVIGTERVRETKD